MQNHILQVLQQHGFVVEGFPVAQVEEHGASNAKIMGSIPRKARADQM